MSDQLQKAEFNRREFIAATAATGLSLSVAEALGQEAKSKDEINIALIGAGTQGRVLMNSLLKIPGVRIKAVGDVWEYSQRYASRYVKKFGHENNVYADYKELLATEKDLDAVVTAAPDWMHAPITIAALEAGLHVYCEKMMSNSVEAARNMVKARDKSGKLLQIGHQRRSNPRYLHVKNKLLGEAKLLGPQINYANAQWNRGIKTDNSWPSKYEMSKEDLEKWGYDSMHTFRNWRWFKKYGGGPISDLGAHQIDVLNWFYGSTPKAVMGSGGVDFYEKVEHNDTNMLIYEYDLPNSKTGRAFYQVLTTTSSLGFLERFMGTEGTLAFSEAPRWNEVYREISTEEEWTKWAEKGYIAKEGAAAAGEEGKEQVVDVRQSPAPEKWIIPVENDKPIHMYHLENFFSAIRDGVPLNCPAEIGFQTCATVMKGTEAINTGKRIEFTADDFKI
jgi:predicted dehydrogenase